MPYKYVEDARSHARKYYRKHREERLAYMRKYYPANRDVISAKTKKRRALRSDEEREQRRQYAQQWRNNNRVRDRTWHRLYRKPYLENLKQQVLDKFGRQCASCGYDDVRALDLDHVRNDGASERKVGSGTRFKRALENADGRYQLLCRNCNWIKHLETVRSE